MHEAPLQHLPKNFRDYRKHYGWGTREAYELLGNMPHAVTDMMGASPISRSSEKAELIGLAKTYRDYFIKNPQKTHIFPLSGMTFQYEFARGVRDALVLKAPVHSLLMDKTFSNRVGTKWLTRHLVDRQFDLKKTGIVIHDDIDKGETIRHLAEASGVPSGEIVVHELTPMQGLTDYADIRKVPILGREREVSKYSFQTKVFSADGTLSMKDTKSLSDYVPGWGRVPSHVLTPEEKAFVKQAVYAAGIASARELQGRESGVRGLFRRLLPP